MPTPSPALFIALTALALGASPAHTVAQGQGSAPHIELAHVESRPLTRSTPLTAELQPFLQTDIEARVPGYVERVLVDRGSHVRRGQLLLQLSAPEMAADTSAASASVHAAEADLAAAEAQAAAAASTFAKLTEAAKTPGAVAGNELLQAGKAQEAADALVASRRASVRSATDRLHATGAMQSYLRITAPFDGVITDRLVHPGNRVDATGHQPLLKLQQTTRLRLVVPVPESFTGAIARGKAVSFHVPARPGKTYTGTIARIPNALDPQSRAMMVELDVRNPDATLAPGMYPTVDWPVAAGAPALLVPSTAVVSTTERTFVISDTNGHAHWVNVRKGPAAGDQISVQGDLSPGQPIVKRATDEIREGTPLR
ncbi:MAG TPA: efflux RND transporter periplasmic adaptor subunit [Acidobacteriaceae bacterium]|jgi:RND family efflux transporter MFP subunit|nr:efflux RND transporter periplasmic adaptor subunit [Acidobacteriaceae bacterium]